MGYKDNKEIKVFDNFKPESKFQSGFKKPDNINIIDKPVIESTETNLAKSTDSVEPNKLKDEPELQESKVPPELQKGKFMILSQNNDYTIVRFHTIPVRVNKVDTTKKITDFLEVEYSMGENGMPIFHV